MKKLGERFHLSALYTEDLKASGKRVYRVVYVIERICGICSFGHGWGCHAVESLMNIEVPERAEYLRTIWHELSRVHSHMLAGTLADSFSFESLFMHC